MSKWLLPHSGENVERFMQCLFSCNISHMMYLGDRFALIVGLCLLSSGVCKSIHYYLNSIAKDSGILGISKGWKGKSRVKKTRTLGGSILAMLIMSVRVWKNTSNWSMKSHMVVIDRHLLVPARYGKEWAIFVGQLCISWPARISRGAWCIYGNWCKWQEIGP